MASKNKEKLNEKTFSLTAILFFIDCLFKYPKDFPDNEAVLIWNQSLLILPKKGSIKLKAGNEIIVSCPGPTNYLLKSKLLFLSNIKIS